MFRKMTAYILRYLFVPAADPGFLRRGSPTYYLAKFPRKLHENEENWTGGVQKLTL